MAVQDLRNFADDSDPEDPDYEDQDGDSEEVPAQPAEGLDSPSLDPEEAALREARTNRSWAELQAEEDAFLQAAMKRRPPLAKAGSKLEDPLMRQFRVKHARVKRPKPTRDEVLADLKKYVYACAETSVSTTDVANEKKRKMRASMTFARKVAAASVEAEITQPVKKRAVAAVEIDAPTEKPVSLVGKSHADWKAYCKREGLEKLRQDRRAGALERRAFLARTAARREELRLAERRAAGRARVSAAARREMNSGP